jgi:hypothetical protein
LRPGAFDRLIASALAGKLAGAAGRANHIANNNHLYVAPYLMALNKGAYLAMGSPSCRDTGRGDVAEELTYAAENKGITIEFLWPTSSADDIWELTPGRRFGHGTVYENDFWHAFEIRQPQHQAAFIKKCNEIVAGVIATS